MPICQKEDVSLAKKECQSGKKRMWRGSKTFMFKASTIIVDIILFLDEEKENFALCVYIRLVVSLTEL